MYHPLGRPSLLRFAIISFAIAISHVTSAAALTYYISATSGNDANPGTAAQPFRTIQKCISLWDGINQVSCRGAGTFNESLSIAKGGPSSTQRNQLLPWDTNGNGNLADETFVLDGQNLRSVGIDVASGAPNPDNVEIGYLTIQNFAPPSPAACSTDTNGGNAAGDASLLHFVCTSDGCSDWWIHHNTFRHLADGCGWNTGGSGLIALQPRGIPNAIIEYNTFDSIGGFIMRYAGGNNITIRNNSFTIVSAGIKLWPTTGPAGQPLSGIVITNNAFACDGDGANPNGPCKSQSAVALSDATLNALIADNTFTDCPLAISLQASTTYSGGLDNVGAIIERNKIYGSERICNQYSTGSIELANCDGNRHVKNTIVRNNLLEFTGGPCTTSANCGTLSCNSSTHHCQNSSGALSMTDGSSTSFQNGFQIYNNTVMNYAYGIRLDQCRDSGGQPYSYQLNTITLKNNSFSGITGAIWAPFNTWVTPPSMPTNWVSDYNSFSTVNNWGWPNSMNFTTWRSTTAQDAHSNLCSPTFATSGDFHLSSTDSCDRDLGIAISGYTNDIDGNSRPVGAAWDIGADEYSSGGAPPAAPSNLRVAQ